MSGCCYDIVKFFLFIINFIALIAFGLLCAGGVYVLYKSQEILGVHVEPDLSVDNATAIYFSLILIFLVLSGFLALFTFLGCCGAACQNRCMLGSFIIILFVFLGANVGAIAFMYHTFPEGEAEMFRTELKATLPYYNVRDSISISRKFWDFVQPELRCCGVDSPSDWETGSLKPGRKVPASCCQPGREDDCVYEPDVDSAFLKGCWERVEWPVRGVFWGIPGLMALVLMCALCVCTGAERRNRDNYDDFEDVSNERQRRNRRKNRGPVFIGEDLDQETGYVYRDANYPQSPPFNPDYAGTLQADPYSQSASGYPTGIIQPPASAPPSNDYRQPLLTRPPAYHEVVSSRR